VLERGCILDELDDVMVEADRRLQDPGRQVLLRSLPPMMTTVDSRTDQGLPRVPGRVQESLCGCKFRQDAAVLHAVEDSAQRQDVLLLRQHVGEPRLAAMQHVVPRGQGASRFGA
jgi:hypothetical protein